MRRPPCAATTRMSRPSKTGATTTATQAFPADVTTVCKFLEAQGPCAVSPSTVRRRLYGIRKAHRLLNLPDPTLHEDVNLSLRKARRMKPNRPKQAKGLTREYLDKFLAAQPDTPWGIRNRAILSLGYDLLARRSELVALRTEDISWRADGTLRVLIRRSKTDQLGQGRFAFTSKRTGDLVETWLEFRGHIHRAALLPDLSREGDRP